MIKRLLTRAVGRLRGQPDLAWYRAQGALIGQGVHLGPGTLLDPPHCWLITVGDDVTFAPGVLVLAHDASTKHLIGHTLVAPVVIGDGCFLGAHALVLPGVTLGARAVVGAGAVVTKDVAPGAVVVGNPAAQVTTIEELSARHAAARDAGQTYDLGWTVGGGISPARRRKMREQLSGGRGYLL